MVAFEKRKEVRLQKESDAQYRCMCNDCEAENDPGSPCRGCDGIFCADHFYDHNCTNTAVLPKGQKILNVAHFLKTPAKQTSLADSKTLAVAKATSTLKTPAPSNAEMNGVTIKRKGSCDPIANPSAKKPTPPPSLRKYCFAHGYDVHNGLKCETMQEDKYTHAMRKATSHCTLPGKAPNQYLDGCEDNLYS
jgi:hypothetical protein